MCTRVRYESFNLFSVSLFSLLASVAGTCMRTYSLDPLQLRLISVGTPQPIKMLGTPQLAVAESQEVTLIIRVIPFG